MRRIVVAMAMVIAMAFPAAVSADTTGGYSEPPPAGSSGGMTVEILTVHQVARLVVEVELGVTCQPRPASEYPVYSGWEDRWIGLWAKQVNGRSIAYAFSDIAFDADAVCDGTRHVLKVAASADPSGVPFKNGTAVVAAAGSASWYSENWETGESDFHNASASTGWIKVRLGR